MPEFRFSALAGRRLHLVVCGSIAAYKAVELMRMAMKAGLGVGVTVTPAAARFVTPHPGSTSRGQKEPLSFFIRAH